MSPDTKRAHPQTAASLTNGAVVPRPNSPEYGGHRLVEPDHKSPCRQIAR